MHKDVNSTGGAQIEEIGDLQFPLLATCHKEQDLSIWCHDALRLQAASTNLYCTLDQEGVYYLEN